MIIVRKPTVQDAATRFKDATAGAPPMKYGGLSREETISALRRAKSDEEVAAILGNADWNKLVCDECGEAHDLMLYFSAASICWGCLGDAANLYNEAMADPFAGGDE